MSEAERYAENLRHLFPMEQDDPFLFPAITAGAKNLLLQSLSRERAALLDKTPIVVLKFTEHTVAKLLNGMTDFERKQWERFAYLDAGALKVPGTANEYVIVIFFHLPMILRFLSNLGGWYISKSGQTDPESRIQIGNALTQIFAFMHAKRRIDKLPDLMAGPKDRPGTIHADALHLFSTSFIIAHEFSHISLGHLDSGTIVGTGQNNSGYYRRFRALR
jgi:hypothetical protein